LLNKALLDTDTYSEILQAVDPNATRNSTAYRQAQGILTLSAVTVMEVIRGFQKNQSQRKLQTFLSAIAVEGMTSGLSRDRSAIQEGSP
jgi:tRNA(fMet)-specific endonuclease VapC